MGILSWFTKAPEKAIDVVGDIASNMAKGIDSVWYTDQEKAENSLEITKLKTEFTTKTMDIWLQVQEKTAAESSIRSVTRRIIAVAFVAVYLIHILGGSIVYQFDKDYSTHLFATGKSMSTIIMTIVIFYFGYYAISNVLTARKGK